MKRVLVIVLLCAFVGIAGAEEEKKESLLGKIMDVSVSPIKEILSPYEQLGTIVVTPSRYEESELNVGKNVTIIDEAAVEDSYVRYVPKLLEPMPGTVVRDYLGNGKTVQVDLRGFGDTAASNTLVLIDGRRTNQIDISGVDWAQISVDSIEKIEITRGGQSVLYGDNATGGVINIITKSGKGIKPEVGAGYRTGSYRYNYYEAYAQGGMDFLDYYGSTSYSTNSGYRVNNELESSNFNGKITMKPVESIKVRIEGGYHKDWYGLPGALRQVDLDRVGWRGTIHPNDTAKTQDAYLMAGPEIKYDFGQTAIFFSGDIISRGRRTNATYYYNDGTNSEIENYIRTIGVNPKLSFTTDFAGISNRIMTGLDYYGNKDEISSTHFDMNPIFPFNFFMNGKDRLIIDKDTLGLYITDTAELLSCLNINGGYRAEWAWYNFDQRSVVAAINTSQALEHGVEAGINYKYNKNSSVYANYSRSFRFPAVDEWFIAQYQDAFTGAIQGGLNLNLRPQTSNNYEIGIKESSSKYVYLKADYFIMDTRHELYFDPVNFTNAVYDRTMRNGFELEAHVYPIKGLDGFAYYTYEKAYYVGGTFAGNEIPMVPCNKFSTGFDYTFMDCVRFNYMANFVGSRRFINDQLGRAPILKSYVTHDIKISYKKHDLNIYCAINNIFNEKYSDSATTNAAGTTQAYYPSPGANYVIGAQYKF